MPVQPTRFSRLSVGYSGSGSTIAEAGHDLSFIDGYGDSLSLGTTTTKITDVLLASTWTIDPGSLAANVSSLFSHAVPGAVAGDIPLVQAGSSLSNGFNIHAYVESANSLVYEITNVAGATQDLSVTTLSALLFRASN